MKEHKIHVFYNHEDKESSHLIGSLLKRLELCARNWNARKTSELPALAMSFHDNTDELSALTQEQVQEINNTQASVIMLIAPNFLLSQDLLTGETGRLLLEGNDESLRLFVYCEKIAFKEVLVTSRSNHVWITDSASGQHLTCDSTVNVIDASWEGKEAIQRCLEQWLADKSRDFTATATPEVNSTRGNTMPTPAETRLNAEIDLVKAQRLVSKLKPGDTTSPCDFLLTMALALGIFAYTGSIFGGALGLVCLAMIALIVFWVAKFALALHRLRKAQDAYEAAIEQEEAYETRMGLVGAN